MKILLKLLNHIWGIDFFLILLHYKVNGHLIVFIRYLDNTYKRRASRILSNKNIRKAWGGVSRWWLCVLVHFTELGQTFVNVFNMSKKQGESLAFFCCW